MKKFRIVAILLVMCLASSCFVGSTFAKYSSSANANAEATVAKWSIKVDTSDIAKNETITFNLFKTVKGYDETAPTGDNDDDDLEVRDLGEIIAPGTQGEAGFTIVNASDVEITYTVTYEIKNAADIPLEFSVDGGTSWTPWNSMTDDDSDGDRTLSVTETDVSWGDTEYDESLKWRWAYSNNSTTDNAFGIMDPLPTVFVTATVTATQNN